MKYFLIKADDALPQPQISGWPATLPVKLLNRDQYRNANKWTAFVVQQYAELPLPDLISSPYWMVTQPYVELIRQYEPEMPFRHVILNDRENRRKQTYGIPILSSVDCLHPESQLNRGQSVLLRGILDGTKIHDQVIFRLGGVKHSYIVGNLDIVESMFRRKIIGMAVQELETVWL